MTDFGTCHNGTGSRCTGGPQPGVVALRNMVMRLFPIFGSLGIYNCRPVRGGGSLSTHGEGRGWDCRCNANIPNEREAGDDLAKLLVQVHKYLGIQRIIWNRRQWDTNTKAWRAYGGVSPHTDHLHIELCWASASGPKRLTEPYVWLILNGEDEMTPAQEAKLDQALAALGTLSGRVAALEVSLGVPYEKGLTVQKSLIKRIQVEDENGPVFEADGVTPKWDWVEHMIVLEDRMDVFDLTLARIEAAVTT